MIPRSTGALLAELTQITRRNLIAAESLLELSSETLHLRPRPGAWNALECFAHLNAYGDFYLTEICQQVENSSHHIAQPTYIPCWLGDKLAESMKPGPNSRRMKSPRKANPLYFSEPVDRSAITTFIRQQQKILFMLPRAAQVDLTRTKTRISLTRLFKLRLCDALRLVIYHNWRHVDQAQRAVAGR